MADAALLGLIVGLLAGIVAMTYDLFDDLDWGWSDAVVPIVVFPLFSSSAFVVVLLLARWTLLR